MDAATLLSSLAARGTSADTSSLLNSLTARGSSGRLKITYFVDVKEDF